MQPKKQTVPFKGTPEQEKALKDAIHQLKEEKGALMPVLQKAQEIQRAAQVIYRALDCKGFARVDLFLTPSGDVVFNEVNTIPGFTTHSRYPSMMRGIGLDFSALITRMIQTEV